MKTLASVFDEISATHAQRTAVVEDGREIRYAELRNMVVVRAWQLDVLGIGAGDRVALLLPNSAEFVVTYFAIVWRGAIVVPLNDSYQQNELLYFLETCDVAVLVTSRESESLARDVLEMCQTPRRLLLVEDDPPGADPPPNYNVPYSGLSPDAPLMEQFSSGSTGTPKRITRTHSNLVFEIGSLQRTFAITEEDRFLGVAPFSHVNGLVRSMMASILSGACLYPLAKFDRQATAAAIARNRLTVFIGVPFMFSILAKSRFRPAPDFSSLRLCASASAPMPDKLNRLFHEHFGHYVRQLYGSTETGTISCNRSIDPQLSLNSVGTPVEGVEIMVLADDGSEAATGKMGEIAVRGPGVIRAYAGAEEINRDAFRDGWFLTGDLGRVGDDGLLYLLGRKKFFINKGGYKIDPREIEELLEEHPAVEEAAVVGVPTQFADEKVKAVVVPCADVSAHELVEHCRGRIAEFKIPSLIELCDSLPKTSTGKIRKNMLKETVQGKET